MPFVCKTQVDIRSHSAMPMLLNSSTAQSTGTLQITLKRDGHSYVLNIWWNTSQYTRFIRTYSLDFLEKKVIHDVGNIFLSIYKGGSSIIVPTIVVNLHKITLVYSCSFKSIKFVVLWFLWFFFK